METTDDRRPLMQERLERHHELYPTIPVREDYYEDLFAHSVHGKTMPRGWPYDVECQLGVRYSCKSETSDDIRESVVNLSKLFQDRHLQNHLHDLIPYAKQKLLDHLPCYDRLYVLRYFEEYYQELEIPKPLLVEQFPLLEFGKGRKGRTGYTPSGLKVRIDVSAQKYVVVCPVSLCVDEYKYRIRGRNDGTQIHARKPAIDGECDGSGSPDDQGTAGTYSHDTKGLPRVWA